ncbi:MAG: DUF5698 domain-containing protein [Flammeovirgaceae bacterium]|nr:DUF5698 domain-containing protein [Flammeovirgaceae bacterium]
MESTLYNNEVFSFIILPLLIFLARIFDVSINTIRIIYVLGGRRITATLLGFFESFIWLMAIRQIFEHLDNWLCYIAYPAGFACGILVGMVIEERIAYGKVIVRIITRKDTQTLQAFLIDQGFRFTVVNGVGAEGPEHGVRLFAQFWRMFLQIFFYSANILGKILHRKRKSTLIGFV